MERIETGVIRAGAVRVVAVSLVVRSRARNNNRICQVESSIQADNFIVKKL